MTLRQTLLSLSLLAGLGAFAPAALAAGTCYNVAADGSCLDDQAPTTGQFNNAADQVGAHTATGLRTTQAHANVRIAQATFVLAHNICRYVDNPGSRGVAVFIGLENVGEWTSFIGNPPAGVNLNYCCQPATVQICGKATQIPFGVSGKAYSFTGGYNFKATYSCGANLSGIAPTIDTSWAVTTSGQCADPTPTNPGCHNGDKGDATCNVGDDGGQTHDGGHHGPGGGGAGDGGDA